MTEQELAELRRHERRDFKVKLIYVLVGLFCVCVLAYR